ncbi:MAG: glycoside hydrolase family 43 protein [Lentisphaeria bacterium]|nr:glycoside hydrolase family 43 protein [Lentisphaeria bacterium]
MSTMSFKKAFFSLCAFACIVGGAKADQPVISHVYTADPNAFVFNDRIYIICSHDIANQRGYDLFDYELVSTDDLQNWTDHGFVFSVGRGAGPYNEGKTVAPWAGHCYAPGTAIRNGKVYLYFPDGGSSIGVAVADRPEGPYTDPLGKPLIAGNVSNYASRWLFDPAGFVDDDGRAFVYYGGNGNDQARILELNKDMISVFPEAIHLNVPKFFEASFMHKYKGKYYFSYSTQFSPTANIDYLVSDSPTGPFEYKGTILDNPKQNLGNNNHASIIEYKGHWYIAYHDRKLAIASNLRNKSDSRCVNFDELFYNEDGTIKKVVETEHGPKQLKNFDPMKKCRFVTMNKSGKILTEAEAKEQQLPALKSTMGPNKETVLASMQNNSWIRVSGVDFSKKPTGGTLSYSAKDGNTSIEIRKGAADGDLLATVKLPSTDGAWKELDFKLDKAVDGVVDYLYFVFKVAGNATADHMNPTTVTVAAAGGMPQGGFGGGFGGGMPQGGFGQGGQRPQGGFGQGGQRPQGGFGQGGQGGQRPQGGFGQGGQRPQGQGGQRPQGGFGGFGPQQGNAQADGPKPVESTVLLDWYQFK